MPVALSWLLMFAMAPLFAHASDIPAERPADKPPLTIQPLHPTPVETYRGMAARLEFRVVNTSSRKIVIHSVAPRKGDGAGTATPATLEPGGTGKIELTYTFPEAIGRGQVNFLVKTDDPLLSTLVIRIPYFVQSAYDPEFAILDFGEVFPGDRKKTVLEMGSREVDRLAFTRVVSKPEWMDVSFERSTSSDPQTVAIVATMNRTPALGISIGEVVLDSNVDVDTQLRIPVIIRSFSQYSAAPLPLSFGSVLEGESKTAVLKVRRPDGKKAVKISRIETGSDALSTRVSPCGTGCAEVAFTFESTKAKRGLRKRIDIFFEDDSVPLTVPIDALVLPNNVGISDLGDLDSITVRSKTSDLEKR